MGRCGGVSRWIPDIDVYAVVLKFGDHVDHAGVAQIGAIFLEGQPHYQNAGSDYLHFAPNNRFQHLSGDVGTHAVVDAATGQNNFWLITDSLRFVRQIVGPGMVQILLQQGRIVGQYMVALTPK